MNSGNGNPIDNADPNVPLTVRGQRGGHVSRREAMQWVLGAMAAGSFAPDALAQEVGRQVAPQDVAAQQPPPLVAGGYGVDPKLVKTYTPGEVWPLTLSDAQRATATALADLILPKDHLGPAASELGVVAMVDEWISAPYPLQRADRPVILDGLAWMEAESKRRFDRSFIVLAANVQREICDDVCFIETAKPQFREAAAFFSRFRALCAAAYYSTPPGWQALGYVGNTPLASYDGPPPEVLERLGVTQTVA